MLVFSCLVFRGYENLTVIPESLFVFFYTIDAFFILQRTFTQLLQHNIKRNRSSGVHEHKHLIQTRSGEATSDLLCMAALWFLPQSEGSLNGLFPCISLKACWDSLYTYHATANKKRWKL